MTFSSHPLCVSLVENGSGSFLGISVDTLVSTLVTALMAILIFSLGLHYKRYYDKRIEFDELKATERYFYLLLDGLINVVERLAEVQSLLARQLNDTTTSDYNVEVIIAMNIEEVMRIPQEKLFKIFVLNKIGDSNIRIQYFERIKKNINAIKLIDGESRDRFTEFMRKQGRYEQDFNEYAIIIGKHIDDFVHQLHSTHYQPGTDTFTDRLDEILGTWQKLTDRRNPFVMNESLLSPLRDHFSGFPKHPLGRRWLDPVMGCIYAFENYDKNRIVNAEQFLHYDRVLEKSRQQLRTTLDQVRSLEDNKPKWYKLFY